MWNSIAKEQVVILISVLLSVFVGVFGMSNIVAHADDGCGGSVPDLTLDQSDSAEIVYQINLIRRARGFPPYKISEKLMLSAAYHANDMVEDDYFKRGTNDIVDGELVLVCSFSERINSFYPELNVSDGEDEVDSISLVGSETSVDEVVDLWLNLELTQGTVLASMLREIGVGQEVEPDSGFVKTVAEYGLNVDYYPLVIDNEAVEMADSNTVQLYVYGDWDEIRIRENGGAWSDWMPFPNDSNEIAWDFSPIDDENEIEAEMRNGSVTVQASDMIMKADPTSIKLQENIASTDWLRIAHTVIAVGSAGMVMLTVLAIVVRANPLLNTEK